MASKVTKLSGAAQRHLLNNPMLAAEVAETCGVGLSGISSAIIRNSKSLANYRAVLLIAKHMGVSPDEIIVP